MQTIDWQELYAANRAAIEGSGVGAARPAPGPLIGGGRGSGSAPGGPLVHVPARLPDGAAPLVVMLHGCTQTAASFAAATRMSEAADRHGFVVLYPEQAREANVQGCWNWFEPAHQARDAGEPGAIAAATRRIVAGEAGVAVDPRRVLVAGLSAGGAMAAIMGAAYPDLFAAVAVHSGLPYRAATSLPDAFTAMARGPSDLVAVADAPPTIVIHGSADRTVAPVNGVAILRQRLGRDPGRPSGTVRGTVEGGFAYTRRRWGNELEHVEVEGLGHAWSGGAAGAPHADPRGPSANDAIWGFFARAAPARAGRRALPAPVR
jgi:poly(hydroxyalkanoate) depolymerase family esterase